MKIDINSLFFNSSIRGGTATPAWGTAVGQSKTDNYKINESIPGIKEIIFGLNYKICPNIQNLDYSKMSKNRDILYFSIFDKIFINGTRIFDNGYIITFVNEKSQSHKGRLIISYPYYLKFDDGNIKIDNKQTIDKIAEILECENGTWFVYDISIVNQDELHFSAIVVNKEESTEYNEAKERSEEWNELIPDTYKYKQNYNESDISFNNFTSNSPHTAINRIYFGPPGTGKSYTIKEFLKQNNANPDQYARVTFHPDYDYHSFVGGYKPIMENDQIKYKFVPQVFTNLYVKAMQNPSRHYYLVIEEINRGNCAEIFGDIFQLLDRNPEYNIEPSEELKIYLKEKGEEISVNLLNDGKLQMPKNLSVLASMNTSDQSLYPMDSAFKRRWEWEFVPINTQCNHSDFIIKVNDTHQYKWLEFLERVNKKIYEVTKSEDKQIGNWFIDAQKTENIISKELFINKVLFYLWNDVFKDETYHSDNIFVEKSEDGIKKQIISYNDFYNETLQDELLIQLFERILDIENQYREVSNQEEEAILNEE